LGVTSGRDSFGRFAKGMGQNSSAKKFATRREPPNWTISKIIYRPGGKIDYEIGRKDPSKGAVGSWLKFLDCSGWEQ
jgi:hypothetical protein